MRVMKMTGDDRGEKRDAYSTRDDEEPEAKKLRANPRVYFSIRIDGEFA